MPELLWNFYSMYKINERRRCPHDIDGRLACRRPVYYICNYWTLLRKLLSENCAVVQLSHIFLCIWNPAKAAFNKKRVLFTRTLDSELRKKLVKCHIWSIALYGAENWTLRTVDQKNLESLKCGAGEGWKISFGPIMWEMTKYYLESRSRGICYMKQLKGRLTWLVTFCVETAFYNGLRWDRSDRKTRKKT